ncbi:hypothetical protein Droror1_Dr00006037 [Drosera rotundifolia]
MSASVLLLLPFVLLLLLSLLLLPHPAILPFSSSSSSPVQPPPLASAAVPIAAAAALPLPLHRHLPKQWLGFLIWGSIAGMIPRWISGFPPPFPHHPDAQDFWVSNTHTTLRYRVSKF